MAQDDLYLEFLNKLKADKTEAEIADFLAGAMEYSAAQLYLALFYFLEEQDLEAIAKIADVKAQEEEIRKRFQERTGITIIEFIQNLRDTISKNYLFPELRTKVAAQAAPQVQK